MWWSGNPLKLPSWFTTIIVGSDMVASQGYLCLKNVMTYTMSKDLQENASALPCAIFFNKLMYWSLEYSVLTIKNIANYDLWIITSQC